jgi:hypothetical protein
LLYAFIASSVSWVKYCFDFGFLPLGMCNFFII